MPDPYFSLIQPMGPDGIARYRSGPATGGPWATYLQHGGPPNALAVTVAEQLLARETGRTDLRAVRIAADFLAPVPVADLTVRATVLRAARSAALVDVALAADGRRGADGANERDCLLARVWFLRDADTSAVVPPAGPPAMVAPDGVSGLDASFPYGASLEWRFVAGRMGEPGPGAAWVRPCTPLLTDHDMSPLARTVLIADSASGISAELPWDTWSFVNVDLDVHLVRPVDGEWLLMEAVTVLGPHGSAMARSTLSDVHGTVGAGLQSLLLAPMTE